MSEDRAIELVRRLLKVLCIWPKPKFKVVIVDSVMHTGGGFEIRTLYPYGWLIYISNDEGYTIIKRGANEKNIAGRI